MRTRGAPLGLSACIGNSPLEGRGITKKAPNSLQRCTIHNEYTLTHTWTHAVYSLSHCCYADLCNLNLCWGLLACLDSFFDFWTSFCTPQQRNLTCERNKNYSDSECLFAFSLAQLTGTLSALKIITARISRLSEVAFLFSNVDLCRLVG